MMRINLVHRQADTPRRLLRELRLLQPKSSHSPFPISFPLPMHVPPHTHTHAGVRQAHNRNSFLFTMELSLFSMVSVLLVQTGMGLLNGSADTTNVITVLQFDGWTLMSLIPVLSNGTSFPLPLPLPSPSCPSS